MGTDYRFAGFEAAERTCAVERSAAHQPYFVSPVLPFHKKIDAFFSFGIKTHFTVMKEFGALPVNGSRRHSKHREIISNLVLRDIAKPLFFPDDEIACRRCDNYSQKQYNQRRMIFEKRDKAQSLNRQLRGDIDGISCRIRNDKLYTICAT